MFDELKAVGNKLAPIKEYRNEKPFVFLEQSFKPHFSSSYGELCYYKANVKNLFIKLREGKIEMENSLASFFHGHNTFDLTLSQTKAVINQIARVTELKPGELYLRKLAIGFTIPITTDPLDIIKQYRFHKNKPLTPMLKNGRAYGGKFVHTHYEVKTYSKGLEQYLRYRRKFDNENLLRIELVLKYPAIPKEIGTLAALVKPGNWELLFNLFMEHYESVIKLPMIKYTELPPKGLAKQIASEEERYWLCLKAYNRETYKTYKKRFNDEMRNGDNTVHDRIKASLIEQFAALLQNKFTPAFSLVL